MQREKEVRDKNIEIDKVQILAYEHALRNKKTALNLVHPNSRKLCH